MNSTRSLPVAPLVLTLVAAQFLVMLDSSIINVALASIARDLRLSAVDTAWILNAYFLSFGGLLLISGRAADVFGRRRVFLVGTAVLFAGSLLGGFASTDALLIAARLVQGAGAAMLSPAAMSVILARFEGPARTRAMSGWGAASTVGGASGVTVGGLLSAAFGWQSVMFVTATVAAVVGLAAWRLLPSDLSGSRRRFDATGAGLLTGSAVAVVFAILETPRSGFASLQVLGALVLGVACLLGFVVVERGSVDPVLPLAALRDPRVAGGMAVNLLGGAARVACFFLVALLLQQVLDYDPATAGLAMLPTSLAGFAVSTLLLPRALDKLGAQRVVVIGLLLLVVAHLMLSGVDHGDPYALRVLPALLIAATGVSFSFTPATLVIAEGMAASNAGVSSGVASATAQIGGAIGIAVFGALDAASRMQMVAAGGSELSAAHAGLSTAHAAAAATAGLAAVVAVLTFPALRRLAIATRASSASGA
jgi:EmrB/QacA subfamily drug resistance transporter